MAAVQGNFWQRLNRLVRHRWHDDQVARSVDAKAMEQLTAAVARSEQRHSGQIRICIEGGLPPSYLWRGACPRERAVTLFGKLRVWDTEHNNGVLIYLLLADRALEIVADRALARAVPSAAWEAIMASMQEALRGGQYQKALELAVEKVSALLETHSGGATGVANELPDAPAVGPFNY